MNSNADYSLENIASYLKALVASVVADMQLKRARTCEVRADEGERK